MTRSGIDILDQTQEPDLASGASVAVRPALVVAVLAFTLILGLLPFASTLIVHHPDERYYSDGAVIMLETGDWLTPQTGTGEIRLEPPLTYWIEAAGMAVLGISPIGARIGGMVMGAGMLLLVYVLALTAGARRETALLASALLAGNLVIILSTLHALSDQLLTFFMLVAAIGFTGLIFRTDHDRLYGWAAYGGITLAVLSKGLLPIAFVAYTAAFAMVRADRAARRRLWQPLPILVSLGLAGSWFFYQTFNAPAAILNDLLSDQLAERLRNIGPGTMASALFAGLAGLLAPNILFLLAIARGMREGDRPDFREIGSAALYFAGWAALAVFIFMFSSHATHRDVLPVIPLVAVLLAVATQSMAEGSVPAYLRTAFRFTLVVTTMLLIVLLVMSTAILPLWQGLLLIALALAGCVAIWRMIGSQSMPMASAAMSLVPYGTILLAFPFFAALFMPDIGNVLAAALSQNSARYEQTLFVGRPLTAAQTRLHLSAGRGFHQTRSLGDFQDIARFKTIFTDWSEMADALEAMGYVRTEVKAGWRDVDGYDFRVGLETWDLGAQREKNAKKGWVLTRR